MKFTDIDLPQFIQNYADEKGFKKPTQVQVKVAQAYQANEPFLALAPTASGKTLAFAMPIADSLKLHEQQKGPNQEPNTPYALIITPTRELGNQVSKVLKEIAHHAKFKARFISGSNSKLSQSRNEVIDVLISTPQTITTLLKLKKLSFTNLSYLVIDEADQVLDPGFKKELKIITNKLNFNHTHIALLSATFPPLLSEWIKEYFKDIKLKEILIKGDLKQGNQIKTFNIRTNSKDRLITLGTFLKKSLSGRGIIFCSQKNQVNEIKNYFEEFFPKTKVSHVHGDLIGTDRKKNIGKFADSKTQVLIASDIAARGIDILNIDWIFNYTLPKTAIYYLHRVGRLSRDGRPGQVFNLVSSNDDKIVRSINEVILREGHLAIAKLPDLYKKKVNHKTKIKKPPKKITKRTRL